MIHETQKKDGISPFGHPLMFEMKYVMEQARSGSVREVRGKHAGEGCIWSDNAHTRVERVRSITPGDLSGRLMSGFHGS